jgi:uncharacterized membrane protein
MDLLPVTNPTGVLAALCGICAFFLWLERKTRWRLFNFFPPLVFFYVTPALLTNLGVLPSKSTVYDGMKTLVLPAMLVLLMLEVDVIGAFRLMARGVGVMAFGALGIVVGAPIALLLVKHWLDPDAWQAFACLSGSWVGGTANMNAIATAIDASSANFTLAVLGDSVGLLLWFPVMLGAKKYADRFARFSKVDPERLTQLDHAAAALAQVSRAPTYRDYLYLLTAAFGAAFLAEALSKQLPVYEPYLTADIWFMLLVSTIGLAMSFTPLRIIPGSRELGLALVFLFMARTGATADLTEKAEDAVPFLVACAVWITIHGLFCLLGAKLFRTDIHTAAIASAANIGGVGTATIVAAHHKESLVPAGILLALLGYALGNYAGYATSLLCRWVAGDLPV